MNVLVLESDSVLRRLYAQALSADGHQVVAVSSAQVAVQASDAQLPDAVVVNTDIARHNGLEFLYEFKSYTEWRAIPVIVLASRLNHDIIDQASFREHLGVQHIFVRSQLTLSQLCAAISSLENVPAA